MDDDGQHGDASPGDGLYANLFTRVNRAEPVYPSGEPAPDPPNDEGAYRVRVVASGPGFQREAFGSFSALEGSDANGNGLPDPFELEYGVTDWLMLGVGRSSYQKTYSGFAKFRLMRQSTGETNHPLAMSLFTGSSCA